MTNSIRLRLSLWLAGAIAVTASLAAAWSFWNTAAEADELQDDTLAQVVALIAQRPDLVRALASRASDLDRDSSLTVQRVDASSAHDGMALPLPPDLSDGFHTLAVRGVSYRVLVRSIASNERVAVSQPTALRDEITQDGALRSSLPMLLLIPLLALVGGVLVRRVIGPIETLSQDVQTRSQHDLKPLPVEGVATEFRPFIHAVNGLFARLQDALDGERRFIADAAHELRSPLTALSLQAQRLGEVALPEPARERLQALRQGLQRTRHLLDQLLSHARAQIQRPGAEQATSLPAVCRAVIEQLLPLADAKDIDLGMLPGDADVTARGGEADITAIVQNLVDNALRYTPSGGRVDLRLTRRDGTVLLEVVDSGPGIPLDERRRVLDPFFRLPSAPGIGAGLGLAIVRTTVERLGGSLVLDDVQGASGLHVRVTLPSAEAREVAA